MSSTLNPSSPLPPSGWLVLTRPVVAGFNLAGDTKDKRARKTPLEDNLKKWLEKYPVTPEALLGGSRAEYAAIRKRWKIPHDGLRHTSISACAAIYGIAAAVARHGNSERICIDHYLDLFDRQEAMAFYAIMPKASACPQALQDMPDTARVA